MYYRLDTTNCRTGRYPVSRYRRMGGGELNFNIEIPPRHRYPLCPTETTPRARHNNTGLSAWLRIVVLSGTPSYTRRRNKRILLYYEITRTPAVRDLFRRDVRLDRRAKKLLRNPYDTGTAAHARSEHINYFQCPLYGQARMLIYAKRRALK